MAKFMVAGLSVLWIAVGVWGLFPAAFSVMMIGAPGATERPATVILDATIFTFPGVCFAAAAKALSMRAHRPRASLILLLPLISMAIAAAADVWIEHFQGGKFNG